MGRTGFGRRLVEWGAVLTRILSSLLFELRTDIELARFMLWNREREHGTVNTELPLSVCRSLTRQPLSLHTPLLSTTATLSYHLTEELTDDQCHQSPLDTHYTDVTITCYKETTPCSGRRCLSLPGYNEPWLHGEHQPTASYITCYHSR